MLHQNTNMQSNSIELSDEELETVVGASCVTIKVCCDPRPNDCCDAYPHHRHHRHHEHHHGWDNGYDWSNDCCDPCCR